MFDTFDWVGFIPATVTYTEDPGAKTLFWVVIAGSAHDVSLATSNCRNELLAGVPVHDEFANCCSVNFQ